MIQYEVNNNENDKVIMFITGAGVSSWMYQYQKNAFSNFKTIFFDLPGHGENSNIDFTTLENVVNEVESIIAKESLNGKAVMVGHSIGAQIIMHMIQSHSQYIEKAVIISGLNRKIRGMNHITELMVSLTMPLIKYRWFAKAQAKALALPNEMFEDYYSDSLKISKKTLLNIMAENMNFVMERIDGFNIDALILVGDKEKRIMIESAIATKKAIPNSKALIINNASHGIPYEQAELLNQLITAFVENQVLQINGVRAL